MAAYTLNLIPSIQAFDETTVPDRETLVHKFWYVHPLINERLLNHCTTKAYSKILDVGAGPYPFPKATHLIDATPGPQVTVVDIDYEPIPFPPNHFNFVYCRHTVEDIQNPLFVCQELFRSAPNGYIETPSPLVEITRGVDSNMILATQQVPSAYCGYIHHRYIVWSDLKTNTLYCLPKYPLVEYTEYSPAFLKKQIAILNNFPVYWNNYYRWDKDHPPSVVVYRNGINMKIGEDYPALLTRAVTESIEYTNSFVRSVM
jgi:hypothetical protein